jgi:hypothetical protein
MKRATLATLVAVVVSFGVSSVGFAQTTPPAQGATAATPKKKFVAPVKGVAEIGYLKPVVKVVGTEVVTTIKIKNMSLGAIAGLRVDEFWYDKGGNMLPGDSERLRQPLNPGEVVTVELRTPKNAKMDRNSYQFSHANGQIKAKVLTKIE